MYYFILVRKDVSITKNMDSLASLGNAILKGCTEPVRGTVLDLLLPPQRTQAKRMTVKKAGGKKNAHVEALGGQVQHDKWKEKHAAFMKKFALSPPTSYKDSDAFGLQNPCQRELWQLLVNANFGEKIIADVSQNIDRCRVSTNGVCPTVTPNSILCIQAASRQVSPMDTLAMHFFPVHRMKIPTAVKAKTLRSLGGQHHALEISRIGYVHGLGDGEVVLWRWDVRGRWEV